MSPSYLYISDNQMFVHNETGDHAIRSEVLETYLRKVRDSANRNEWKTSGAGAMFTNAYQPGADAQSRVAAVRSHIGCLATKNGELVYAIRIDDTAGIYRKFKNDHTKEGIVISSGDTAYLDFDYKGDRLVVSAAFAGESHIGVLEAGRTVCDMYTDGPSWDSEPVWSKTSPDEIYFSSAGFAVQEKNEEEDEAPAGFMQIPYRQTVGVSRWLKGPSAICRMNIKTGTMEELLSDGNFNFVHPQSSQDGALYYIKRPYKKNKDAGAGGCLVDILLFPFRIVRALFGFFNFFSMKYSGKTLSSTGDVKRRDEGQMIIDGNIVQAEKELRENQNRGDKYPGIIPHTWELRRRDPDGSDALVRRGVVAYRVLDNGDVLISNGSGVLCRSADGREEKVSGAERVTYINM